MRGGPAGFLVLYLALRGLMLLEPGYQDDLKAYRRWAVAAAQQGVSRVYRASDMDYPPLYAYLLLPLGKAYLALSPGAGTPKGGDPALWTALAKLPPLAFDLLIAGLLFRVGQRADREAPPAARGRWRWLLPGAYLANPAVVFDTGYWGHPDSAHSFFVLAATLLAASGRAAAAFVCLTLGTLMKPLAAPFLPMLGALVLFRCGPAGLLRGAVAAGLVTAVVFLPFLLAGEARFVVQRVLLDLDAMPYASVNAHNLWGLIGGAWRPANAPLLGPLTATHVGLALFGVLCLSLLSLAYRLHAREIGVDERRAAVLAAGLGFGFFMFATHMHENHLFVALPLLAVALPAGGAWWRLFVAVTVCVLLNLVLHDPEIPSRWPFTLGGATGVARLSHGRLYYEAELLAVRLATAFNMAVFAVFLRALFRAPPACAGSPGAR